MKPEQLERSVAIAANLAYVVLICTLLYLTVPGVRRVVKRVGATVVWNYNLGTYLISRRPTPGWVKDALETKPEELAQE